MGFFRERELKVLQLYRSKVEKETLITKSHRLPLSLSLPRERQRLDLMCLEYSETSSRKPVEMKEVEEMGCLHMERSYGHRGGNGGTGRKKTEHEGARTDMRKRVQSMVETEK